MKFPEKGINKEKVMDMLRAFQEKDKAWKDAKAFGYVYQAGDEILEVVKEAFNLYFSANALNPTVFESLRQMETEVVAMAADLLHGNEATVGSMTSGGTESILMAVKTAREWARKKDPGIFEPEIIIPDSAHPAFHKACHYFNLAAVVVPVGPDFKAVPAAMEQAITSNTVLIVGSAPSFPQGVVDPIEEIAAIAKKHDLLCHVDSCVGGFMLPFWVELGAPIPAFDFAVDGVTSISADIHKYGYAAKGASVILYKNAELRKAQYYVYANWSGGIYASPSMAGTRPGGAIAAAWAALKFMGKDGYLEKAKSVKKTTEYLMKDINAIPELKILGKPDMSVFSFASDTLDVYEIGDEMGLMGWHLDRQQLPPSLHMTITPAHEEVFEQFLVDLHKAVEKAKKYSTHKLSKQVQINSVKGLKKILPKKIFGKFQEVAAKHSPVGGSRSAAMYGLMGELQGTGNLDEMVKEFLHQLMTEK